MKKTLTVFTPTYNRAYCLHLGYEALKRQTCKDFKWLIIDDGSTDNTKELVDLWISEGAIEIEYHLKENGGMHTGHNAAYERIDTELNVCIDSDDYMPDNGVERILFLWKRFGRREYAGIIGLDQTKNGKIIGTRFPCKLKACKYSELSTKFGVVGDKKIVYRTEIVKKLAPYPEFETEKFVPLYYPILIDRNYDLLCFNEVFCIVDYQEDGSTINIYKQYFRHPKGFKHSRQIELKYHSNIKNKFKSAVHYIASKLILKEFNFQKDSPNKLYTLLAIPFGIIWYWILLKKKHTKRDIKKYIS